MNSKRLVLIAMSVFLSMIFIDETGVAVTLPTIQSHLNMTDISIQWVMNGFFLPLCVFVLFAGKISDHLGARKVFILGITIFIGASVLCSFAMSGTLLILGRVIQGFGGSLLLATYAVLISNTFPANERGVALGTCASVASVFLAIGPFIGGLFSHYLSWRAIFFINLPLGIACWYFIKQGVTADIPSSKDRFDLFGLVLFVVGFTALVFALMQAANYGWNSGITVSLIVIAALLFPVFCYWEFKHKNPLANIRMFAIKEFTAANIILLCTQVVVMSITYWAIWLQISLGYSPLLAGIALLPAGLPILVMARIGGKWLDKSGAKMPIGLGSVIVLFGLFWLTLVAHTENYWLACVGFLAYGIGAPLIISPAIAAVLGSVQPEHRGMASGMLNTMRQLGAALCFAIVGVVITNVYLAQKDSLASSSILYTRAFQYGMAVTTVFAFVSVILALFLLKNKPQINQ